MYGRAIKYKMKKEKLADIDALTAHARAKMSKIPGVITSCSMWNSDGTAYTFSLWESAAAAEAAAPKLKEIWSEVEPYLASTPEVQAFNNAVRLAG